jgi:hypothetical protein
MTLAARGLYRELMDECWLKGSVPSLVAGIAELLGFDESEIAPLLPQIIRCFDVTNGSMVSPFIEQVRSEMDVWRLAQAERRLGKDKHGEPRLTTDSKSEPRLTVDNHGEPELTGNNHGEGVGVGVGVGVGDKEETAKAVSKKPRKPKADPFEKFPEPLVTVCEKIIQQTPQKDPSDRLVRVDPALLIGRVDGLIQGNPAITPGLLLDAWVSYLATKPGMVKAPQYFFGSQADNKDGANWHPFARMIWNKQKNAEDRAKALLEVPS